MWGKRKFITIKIGSGMHGGTFVKRREDDKDWYNNIGKVTINEWMALSEEEKDAKSVIKYLIKSDGSVERKK